MIVRIIKRVIDLNGDIKRKVYVISSEKYRKKNLKLKQNAKDMIINDN